MSLREELEDFLEDLRTLFKRKSPWVRSHEVAHERNYELGYKDGFMDQLETTVQTLEEILE